MLSGKRYGRCAIPGCTSKMWSVVKDISWHVFPKRKVYAAQKKKWVEVVRKLMKDENWTPAKDDKICSRHFTPEDFDDHDSGRKALWHYRAVPSCNLDPVEVDTRYELQQIIDAAKSYDDTRAHLKRNSSTLQDPLMIPTSPTSTSVPESELELPSNNEDNEIDNESQNNGNHSDNEAANSAKGAVLKVCIICYEGILDPNPKAGPSTTSSPGVHFLLSRIMGFGPEIVKELENKFDTQAHRLSETVQTCPSCLVLVDEGLKYYSQIQYMEKRIRQIRDQLRNVVSISGLHEGMKVDPHVVQVYGVIRKKFCPLMNTPSANANPMSRIKTVSKAIIKKRQVYPCLICPTMLSSPPGAVEHRLQNHPGLSLCTGSVPSLQCGKVFRSSEIEQHRKEAHPLFPCTGCVESFSTHELRSLHIRSEHPKPRILTKLPKEVPINSQNWIKPLTSEEIAALSVKMETEDEESEEKPEIMEFGPSLTEDKGEICVETSVGPAVGENGPWCNLLDNDAVGISSELNAEVEKQPSESEVTLENPNPEQQVGQGVTTNRKLYKCGLCSSQFENQSLLLSHFELKHQKKNTRFGCHICRKEFDTLGECESHILTDHSTPNPNKKPCLYQCALCPMKFYTQEQMETHRQRHNNRRQLKNTSNSKFKCPECPVSYINEELLLSHRMEFHEDIPFRCRNCPAIYRSSTAFKRHQAICVESSFKCPQCTKTFHKFPALERHIKFDHEKTVKPFECKVCPKRYQTKTGLTSHQFTHRDDRPFLCSHCGKTFPTRGRLHIHEKGHDTVYNRHYRLLSKQGQKKRIARWRQLNQVHADSSNSQGVPEADPKDS